MGYLSHTVCFLPNDTPSAVLDIGDILDPFTRAEPSFVGQPYPSDLSYYLLLVSYDLSLYCLYIMIYD